MADKTVSLELKIDASGAAQSVGDLKKSIVDLKNQALKAGEDSVIGKQFLKQAGEAKDRLSDLNRQVDNFQDAGAKFGAVSKLVGGLAAGFQAAQGAAALFGSSGEDIQKIMLKVQSATALAQGVQGIAGLGESFKDVGKIIKGPIVGAFTALKGAIGATGIGLLVIAAAALYANFDSVKKLLANIIPESVQKAFGVLKDALGGIYDKVKDLVGLGEAVKSNAKGFEVFGGALGKLVQPLEDANKAQDKWNDQHKKTLEYLKALSDAGQVGSVGYYSFLLSNVNDQLNKLVPGTQAYNDALTKQIDLTTQLEAAQGNAYLSKQQREGITNPEVLANDVLPEFPADLKAEVDWEKFKDELLLQQDADFEATKDQREKDADAKKKANRKKEWNDLLKDKDIRKQIAIDGFNILSSLGQIGIKNAEKQARFQKKLAVAQILVDTASGISNAIQSGKGIPFPANVPIIAGAVAMVLANAAKAKSILSKAGDVSVPSLDSGGAVGAGGGAAPGAPELTQPTTNIPQGTGTTIPETKVYVTETDIKRVTNRVNVIESRATFR